MGRATDEFLKSFTETTVDVLRNDGVENYLPTVAVPSQATVTVIQGIPSGTQHTMALIETIVERGLSEEELLFGVKTGANAVVTGHYVPGAKSQFAEITRVGGEFSVRYGVECAWWIVTSSRQAN